MSNIAMIPAETLRCEKCQNDLSTMSNCALRASRNCPYQAIKTPYVGSTAMGAAFFIFGVAAIGGGFIFSGFGFLFIIAGVILEIAALFITFSQRALIYNATTHQAIQEVTVLGFKLNQTRIGAAQPLDYQATINDPPVTPFSLSMLHAYDEDNMDSDAITQYITDMILLALLSLLKDQLIEIHHARATDQLFGKSAAPFNLFFLTPARASSRNRLGRLEQRILQTIREWSNRRDSSINFGNTSYVRKYVHEFTLDDLMLLICEGKHPSPGRWLITNVVAPEAVNSGLGAIKGSFLKEYQISLDQRRSLSSAYQEAQQWLEDFYNHTDGTARLLRQEVMRSVVNTIYVNNSSD